MGMQIVLQKALWSSAKTQNKGQLSLKKGMCQSSRTVFEARLERTAGWLRPVGYWLGFCAQLSSMHINYINHINNISNINIYQRCVLSVAIEAKGSAMLSAERILIYLEICSRRLFP